MNTRKNVLPSILASILSVAFLANAQAAGTLSGEIGVKLVIGAGCTVGNGSINGTVNNWGTMDFGTQSNLTNVVDAGVVGTGGSNTVTITCSNGLTSSLTLNGGLNGTSAVRNMATNGTDRVPYRLYSDSARTNEITINAPIALVSNGAAQNIPIFGRILPADQSTTTPAAGNYSDTILATLSW